MKLKIKEFNKAVIKGNLLNSSTNDKGHICNYYQNDLAEIVIPDKAIKMVNKLIIKRTIKMEIHLSTTRMEILKR